MDDVEAVLVQKPGDRMHGKVMEVGRRMDHAPMPASQPRVAIARIAALILKAFFIV